MGFKIIRPLLDASRQEILQFLKTAGLKFRTDPTNSQIHFFRNKIRLNLLPLLEKEFQPNIKKILANLSTTTSVDYDFLNKEGERLLENLAVKSRSKNCLSLLLKPPGGSSSKSATGCPAPGNRFT
jgi:tRNA(Ile)-lysidine synthase